MVPTVPASSCLQLMSLKRMFALSASQVPSRKPRRFSGSFSNSSSQKSLLAWLNLSGYLTGSEMIRCLSSLFSICRAANVPVHSSPGQASSLTGVGGLMGPSQVAWPTLKASDLRTKRGPQPPGSPQPPYPLLHSWSTEHKVTSSESCC